MQRLSHIPVQSIEIAESESLMQVVEKTWSEANCQGSPRCSVALLLAPAYLDVFTKDQCEDILNAVYTFIEQSGRGL